MIHNKFRYLLTLVALFAISTGAWAEGTVTVTELKASEMPTSWDNNNNPVKATDLPGFTAVTRDEAKALGAPAAEGEIYVFYAISNNKFIGLCWNNGVLDDNDGQFGLGAIYALQDVFKFYYTGSAEAPITVEWNASTKTGTFSMPGSDVVLTPQYAPAAKWDVVENVEQLPAALEGIIAGQDAAIVTAGQSAQGTVMYAVTTSAEAAPALTAFSATVPTAKNVADDGATVYVWYYIQGQDTPDGQQATEENTFNDTEICTTPLTVQVLTNKFDITLNAANANTIEAGKATVTVGGTAATVTDGKLQGVKMGSEVKMTAKQGYKFRKVEVKKKEAAKPLANATTEDLGKVVGADGNIYANKDAAEAANTTAVAMICYVNEGHGLALALSDISSYGNSWDNSSTYNEGKTAAELCSAWNTSKAVTGATWKLASLSEMNLMINAAGGYAALRDGFSAVGGTNMIDDYYWVSDESSADYAKNINFGGGYDMQEFKDNSYQVRACLEW